MTKVNENAVNGAVAANEEVKETVNTTKVIRRGVGTAKGTSRLKFTHELAKPNGLFLGHLDSITVSTIKIGEESTGMPSFNGLEIPKITIVFASNEENQNKRHYVSLVFTAVESNVRTIPSGKDSWKINTVFDWFKHILDVYVLKGRELTEEETEALSLNYEDFDEDGNYVPVEAEDVINAWKILFENFENIMSRGNEDKPYYKTKDGKNIPVWIKLIRYIKINDKKKGTHWKTVTNGDLVFPTFVGEGCIEVYKQNTAPSIKLDKIREAIQPMNIEEKAKAPNMPNPNIAGGVSPMMGGIPVTDNMNDMTDSVYGINAEAEDMPF